MFILLVYVSIALGFSFLCSIAEAVILSVTPSYIGLLEQEGRKVAAKRLNRLKADVNTPLAAILTLNTIAHTAGAAGAGAQAAKVFGDQYIGIISGILTFLILVFSEIIPKTLGAHYWRQLAPTTGYFLEKLIVLLYPFVMMSALLTRRLSDGPTLKGFNREEFAAMAELSTREGQLEQLESRIIKNLLYADRVLVRDVATPRTVVFSLAASTTIKEYADNFQKERFSRIPVYRDEPEHIAGFVLRNDLLLAQARGQFEAVIEDFLRPIHAIPEALNLAQVFSLFLSRREQIMIVIDEHGGLEGIITLEDAIEKILGFEIIDESDRTPNMRRLARRRWRIRHKAAKNQAPKK